MHVSSQPPSFRVLVFLQLTLVFCHSSPAVGRFEPNFLFSDNMVLQRDRPVPIWGEAEPGMTVAVTFAGQSASATADEAGRWKAVLAPVPAGGPHELKLACGPDELIAKNVLVGDVWFCAGQSNMWWSVFKSKDGQKEVADAYHPKIRLITIPQLGSSRVLANLSGPRWAECSPETAKDFSAVAYYFGRSLFRHNGVPVGLIQSAWGGSAVQSWTSLAGLETNPDAVGITKEYYSVVRRFEKDLAAGIVDERDAYIDKGIQPGEQGWEATELDDSSWPEWNQPAPFGSYGKPAYLQGAIWFRKKIDIPSDWAGKDLILGLGAIGNYDTSYLNGEEIGRTDKSALAGDSGRASREYAIPGHLVLPGTSLVAVRVFNAIGPGGVQGFPEWTKRSISLTQKDNKNASISLAGPWKYKPGNPLPPRGINADPLFHKLPSCLFNGMVSPVIPFAVRGVIWYQGEANTHNAWEYGALFPLMIRSWREAWGEEIPFLYVQLPNLANPSESPTEDSKYNESWNELRDSQSKGLTEPRTAMVAAIDLGSASIHPANKQDLGSRLALAARVFVLGEPGEYSGPLYAGMTVEGSIVRVRFTKTGLGLVARGSETGELRRFAVAGEDQKYVWANAKIDGDSVVVWNDEVPKPVAVSYAWAINPDGCNLYNQAGLPAAPFRSDTWPMRTMGRKSPY